MPQVQGADDRATQAYISMAEERGRKATPQMGYFRTDTILSLEGATIQCVSYGPHELVDLEGLVDEPFGPFGVVRV